MNSKSLETLARNKYKDLFKGLRVYNWEVLNKEKLRVLIVNSTC